MTSNTNNKKMSILSGDIGGTSTRLQLSTVEGNTHNTIKTQTFKNKDFKIFERIVSDFLSDQEIPHIDRACFAFAGPVINGEVSLTNLPWSFSEKKLAKKINIKKLQFINDFSAIAYGIPSLSSDNYITLQAGKPNKIHASAIIGAGTGLGVSFVENINNKAHIITTEGGHCEFAPITPLQTSLLNHLKKTLKRVSVERIVSGIGITNIYKFLRTMPEHAYIENPQLRKIALSSSNFSDSITHFALEHNDHVALTTLDIFIRSYGSFAGNIALTTLPYGGLYIAGGIAPKIRSLMEDGRFMAAYSNKGRMSPLLLDIPIYLITDTYIGLKGAAHHAAHGNAWTD